MSEIRHRIHLIALTIMASAFGFVEAACVTFIRRILLIPNGTDYLSYLRNHGRELSVSAMSAVLDGAGLLRIERVREIATLVLLAAVSWAVGRSLRQRLGVFAWIFAVWDLSYYLFLIPLTGFPRSLFDTDVYFLLPCDSFGPVWFPVIVAMPAMLLIGFRLMRTRSSEPTS